MRAMQRRWQTADRHARPSLTHPLKEVDAAALAVAETPEQIVEILSYVIRSELSVA